MTGEAGFLPHGYCFLWNKPLLWTHVTADVLIGVAYLTISASLAWLLYRARDEIPFGRIVVMFGLFIISCGLTHFLEVVTFWHPIYPTLGAVKVVTAAASVSTAAMMPILAPRIRHTVRAARHGRERELAAARAEARSAALEEANAALAHMNATLTAARDAADAARAEAEQARTSAVEANRIKAEFLAHMSHELRTPLNAIAGHVQLVELGVHGPVTADQRAALARVQGAQQHLLGLINDVLNFARLDAGRVTYERVPIPLAPLVEDVVQLLAPVAAAKRHALAIAPPEPALAALADPEKVRQIVINLLGNAIKFTEPGGRITISAAVPEDTPTRVAVAVRDTGIGIPADKLGTVFDPFVQIRPTSGGTGLGLSISRELARSMGGDITVASTLGVGSCFTLALPRAS
jgi:signal transduction histidine kinase